MTPASSDRKEKVKDGRDSDEIQREEKNKGKVDKLISDIEFMIRRDNHIPGRSTH